MVLIKVNYSLNCYHLNIKPDSLLSIFFVNIEQQIEGEEKKQVFDSEVKYEIVNHMDCAKVKQMIDEFENEYVNLESAVAQKEEISMIRHDKSIVGKKKSNSLSNLAKAKPAPYQVPVRPQPPQSKQPAQKLQAPPPPPPKPPQRNLQVKSTSNIVSSSASISSSSLSSAPLSGSQLPSSQSSQRNLTPGSILI